jgi:hypothetical protein
MAISHIYFNDTLPYGRRLRSMLATNEDADDQLADLISLMTQMRDSDGSQDVHYAEITSRFGFATDAKARAAYDELQSAYSKTSGNGSVSDVRAARDQMFAKLR